MEIELENIPVENLKKATRKLMACDSITKNINFIALIKKFALGIDDRMTGEEAWSCYRDYGRGVKKSDLEVYKETYDKFDHRAFGMSLVEDEGIWRSNFIKLYNAVLERDNKKRMEGESL